MEKSLSPQIDETLKRRLIVLTPLELSLLVNSFLAGWLPVLFTPCPCTQTPIYHLCKAQNFFALFLGVYISSSTLSMVEYLKSLKIVHLSLVSTS